MEPPRCNVKHAKVMKVLHCLLLFTLLPAGVSVNAQILEVDSTWWRTDDVVRAIAEDTVLDRVVIGGDFMRLVPPYPSAHGGVVDLTSGIIREGDVRPDDRVKCVLSDGNGGWYIGGDFIQVGGVYRQHLAHILADGTLGAWNPVVNGAVNAMAAKGDTLYFGGNFTLVNGQSKSHCGAVRLSTGTNVIWSALADNVVRTMAIDGGELFVGGEFQMISGQTRWRIAVYNTSTHALTSWAPAIGGPVHAMAFTAYGVLLGGGFYEVNGVTRYNLASFDRATGVPLAWNPGTNGMVRCMQVSGANIYIGGEFTMVGGSVRKHLALVYSGGSTSTGWVNDTDAPVHSMRLASNDLLLIGGEFSRVAGDARLRAAALGTQGTTQPWLQPWAPGGDGAVRCIDVAGGQAYLGGGFDMLGLTRAHVAMLDDSTGVPLAWSGNTSGPVHTIEVGPALTYIGGDFDTLLTTGALRSNLAAFDNSTGVLHGWNPGANGLVRDLAYHGGMLYAAGVFQFAGGQARTGLAQIDGATGGVGAMSVSASYPSVLHLVHDTLYVGGTFSTINGIARSLLASVKVPAGTLTSFNPNVVNAHPSKNVTHIISDGGRLYFSGYFTSVAGQLVSDHAAVRIANGTLFGWEPDVLTPGAPLAIQGGLVFLSATDDNGANMALRAVFPEEGGATGSMLTANGENSCLIATASGALLLGGPFTQVGSTLVSHFARVRMSPTLHVRAFLEGPFNTFDQIMDSDLAQLGAIPFTEPFTALGYVHSGGGGGEVAPASIYSTGSTNAIVDWILLELRDATNPSVVVASKSALLQRDGDVVSNDRTPIEPFGPDPHGSFFIAVRPRNHLGVMTADPMRIDLSPLVDLTEPGVDTYGISAMNTSPFYNLLWSGDVNFDGVVKYTGAGNDRDPILTRIGGTLPTNTAIGYFQEDVDMSGVVKYTGSNNDRDRILITIGGIVPTEVRNAQLP